MTTLRNKPQRSEAGASAAAVSAYRPEKRSTQGDAAILQMERSLLNSAEGRQDMHNSMSLLDHQTGTTAKQRKTDADTARADKTQDREQSQLTRKEKRAAQEFSFEFLQHPEWQDPENREDALTAIEAIMEKNGIKDPASAAKIAGPLTKWGESRRAAAAEQDDKIELRKREFPLDIELEKAKALTRAQYRASSRAKAQPSWNTHAEGTIEKINMEMLVIRNKLLAENSKVSRFGRGGPDDDKIAGLNAQLELLENAKIEAQANLERGVNGSPAQATEKNQDQQAPQRKYPRAELETEDARRKAVRAAPAVQPETPVQPAAIAPEQQAPAPQQPAQEAGLPEVAGQRRTPAPGRDPLDAILDFPGKVVDHFNQKGTELQIQQESAIISAYDGGASPEQIAESLHMFANPEQNLQYVMSVLQRSQVAQK